MNRQGQEGHSAYRANGKLNEPRKLCLRHSQLTEREDRANSQTKVTALRKLSTSNKSLNKHKQQIADLSLTETTLCFLGVAAGTGM